MAFDAFTEGFVDALRLARTLCYVPVKVVLMVGAVVLAFAHHQPLSVDDAAKVHFPPARNG